MTESAASPEPAAAPAFESAAALAFFVRIRGRSPGWKSVAAPAGSPFRTVLEHEGPQTREEASWTATFDGVLAALEAEPRCFVEPDGAFVWNGPVQEDRLAWQLDGNLYDLGPRLAYVELRGRCPRPIWEKLRTHLGAPKTALLLELPEVGAVVDEAAFLEWAGAQARRG